MSKVIELPGIEGDGVAPVRIAKIDYLAESYIKERDKRCKQTPKEIAAKEKLIDALHKHADKLSKDKDGALIYRYDDLLITLKPGKETLKVKSLSADEPED